MFSPIQTEHGSSKGWIVVVIILCCLVILFTGVDRLQVGDTNVSTDRTLDSGDTAFMLVASAFVMLMNVPGIALYYGGFADYQNQINTMTMHYACHGVVTIVWILWGYALAFGEDRGKIIGNGRAIFLQGLSAKSINPLAPTIPEYTYVLYQWTFACITVALTAGGYMDRMKFHSWVLFMILWTTLVYVPVAHWVWGGGFLSKWGVLDFAGGTVVHVASGMSACIGSIILGKHIKKKTKTKSLTFIMIGSALLWFGWCGFDAGSALAANADAAAAFINTNIAAAVASVCWALLQAYNTGKPTLAGLCDGTIAGLVTITPGAGFVNIMGAVIFGLLAMGSYGMSVVMEKYEPFHDPANAFSVHFIGGVIGAIATGIYADPAILEGRTGFLFGNYKQLGWQIVGILIVAAYSAIITTGIMFLLKYTVGIRVSEKVELEGLDYHINGEFVYEIQNYQKAQQRKASVENLQLKDEYEV